MNKNIIASYKYQLSDLKRSVITYYGVALALFALVSIGMVAVKSSDGISFGGMDFATVVFIFIIGLVSFKENFRMFMQNGVSRKSMFLSKILTVLTLTLILSIADNIIMILCRALTLSIDGLKYNSMFEQIYSHFISGKSGLLICICIFLYNYLLYLSMFAFGTLITLVFYRLNKAGKIAVGVGVPVGLTMVLPFIDSVLFNNNIAQAFKRFLYFSLGLNDCNPYKALLTYILAAAILFAICWILMRRAVIKQ